jgi:hypothetical protein
LQFISRQMILIIQIWSSMSYPIGSRSTNIEFQNHNLRKEAVVPATASFLFLISTMRYTSTQFDLAHHQLLFP